MNLPSPALRCAVAALLLFPAFGSRAQSGEDPKQQFAREVYRTSAADVFHTAPHPLLRSVVVMRIRLREDGRWAAELLRDNVHQPQLTRLAQASVQRLPPPEGLSAEAQQAMREHGFVETWLFINDGRFALRSLAQPQAQLGAALVAVAAAGAAASAASAPLALPAASAAPAPAPAPAASAAVSATLPQQP